MCSQLGFILHEHEYVGILLRFLVSSKTISCLPLKTKLYSPCADLSMCFIRFFSKRESPFLRIFSPKKYSNESIFRFKFTIHNNPPNYTKNVELRFESKTTSVNFVLDGRIQRIVISTHLLANLRPCYWFRVFLFLL